MKALVGLPYPLGATVQTNGVNFALAARSASRVALCVFQYHNPEHTADDEEKRFEMQRTGDIWHVFLEDAKVGLRYGFRVDGTHAPEQALFKNPQKLLLDPYAKQIEGTVALANAEQRAWFHHDDARDNAAVAPKSVVYADDFDWEDDKAPRHAWENTFIYETHVKGFTQQFPELGACAGTYLALADERVIAHLKALGVTAVELLPVHQHLNEWQLQARGLTNYWGYNTLSAFAVEPSYAQTPQNAAIELKTAVKALHRAGIEVILDVVYNHSAEQDLTGAMLCQRGIDNHLWYWHDRAEPSALLNLSGCGNTLNASEPLVTRWILDSLRYFVQEFHIDGFRFDLATILGREPSFNRASKFFHALQQDPTLAPCKLFAEAWDLGCYQVGHMPPEFSQWNGAFRDEVRSFWLHHSGRLDLLAKRFGGSDDIFHPHDYLPHHSLNLITAHDGFTLNDVVSYQHKHNEINGEDNRDGHHDNHSQNHGTEGKTDDPPILAARKNAQSALLATLILAKGTPMLLAGDELSHSQRGNNNAYCQDNDITWLNWSDQPFTATIKALWQIRQHIPALRENRWLKADEVRWLTPESTPMQLENWHDHRRKAMMIQLNERWLILINGKPQPETFTLPPCQSAWVARFSTSTFQLTAHQCQVKTLGMWVFYHEEQNHEPPQP